MPIFLTKAIELYEMICVRHGLMVVGPTGGGKSKNIAVLKEALTHLKVQSVFRSQPLTSCQKPNTPSLMCSWVALVYVVYWEYRCLFAGQVRGFA